LGDTSHIPLDSSCKRGVTMTFYSSLLGTMLQETTHS